MRIGKRLLEQAGPPYVIAEIGVNHDGSADRARELIVVAAEAGADAVKFQYFQTHRLLSQGARLADYQRRAGAADPFDMLRRLELPIDALAELARFARSRGIDPIVTIFSLEHVEPARQIDWAAFKVASPDLVNRPLLEALLETGTPLIISTGAATTEEVQQAMRWLGKSEYALMHCVSAYPTPDAAAHLAGIQALRNLADVPVGYSDHTTAEDTGALAVAAGAALLEKHLTHDRKAAGPDHAISLDPEQFARYVQAARRAGQMLGRTEKFVQDIERDVRQVSRQSVVTTRALKRGHVLEPKDLTLKRPGSGLPPSMLNELFGRRLAGDIAADTPLTESHLDGDRAKSPSTERDPALARR